MNYTSPNATGSLIFTPVANHNGSATITVAVTDDGGIANNGADTVTTTFEVTVIAAVKLLTLDPIGDQFIEELQELTFTITATDMDPTSTSQAFSLDTAAIDFGASMMRPPVFFCGHHQPTKARIYIYLCRDRHQRWRHSIIGFAGVQNNRK